MINPKIEAEQSVIGAILINSGEVMPECEQILSQHNFLVPEYRTVYKTCSELFISNKPIDAVMLVSILGDAYKTILVDCIQSMPSIRNWKSYAEIVETNSKKNKAYSKAIELISDLESDANISDCQETASKAVWALSENKRDQCFSASEGFLDYYCSLQQEPTYISTGFKNLDKYAYIEPGDFVIIGARPSAGKTAFTLQMMLSMAKHKRVVYFSLETKSRKLFGRMASSVSKIGMNRLKTRSDIDFHGLSEAFEIFKGLDFYTVDAAGWTVAQIKAKSIQLGADVIFVDYLGLVQSEGKSPYEKVSNISRDLQIMSKQDNISVIAACQLSRAGKDEPDITHLRESGQIEQDADVIFLLHAPESNESKERNVIIAKNKEGQVGKLRLEFYGNVQTFYEIEERY